MGLSMVKLKNESSDTGRLFGPFETEERADQFIRDAQPRISEYHRGVASERYTLLNHLDHIAR